MKAQPTRRSLRCAIYTRVSTDQGLEQDFNSLDAQREASEAYIKSQAHEGWKPIRDRYDDGGYSGGSMDRPALQKLLDDVRARRVDVVVVYKVDRLTRSLTDFAKLVELFDAHNVSFVSVTQSFNTTTSMGRLTLNVLLSFAQFEREVTGERIRDKFAASKKKGMWMGGVVPLGYRVENRALHVIEDHAELVRGLFRRYLEAGSVVRLKQIIDADKLRLPVRVDGKGRSTGGGLLSRGHIYKLLSNPIYIGRIAHKGCLHEGQHPPIVGRDLWDRVQQRLQDHAATVNTRRMRQSSDALLAGKLFDDRGNRMSPSWARKGPKRWRYYVSQAALQGRKQDAGSIVRLPAAEIERRIVDALGKIELGPSSGASALDDDQVQKSAISTDRGDSAFDRRAEIRALIDRVTVGRTMIRIALLANADGDGEANTLSLPWTTPSPYRRREIIQGANGEAGVARPMPHGARVILIDVLRKAHRWLDKLLCDPRETIEAIASREGKTERSVRMTLSLALLAPDIVQAVIDGRLPRGVGLKRLIDLPVAWPDQWRALGLRAPARS
ncbi:MAG TPA: recombinase family protein [Roseiarcus sp.]|nr:recombinase family protein [Roseiarcus sp.]